jgi:RNA polymerase sigma-70 factor (ECF subfamily)
MDALRSSGPERAAALSRLHDLVWGVARREAALRSGWVYPAAPDHDVLPADLDNLARLATADALRMIIAELGSFGGESRVTTWVCKFAVSAVSERSAQSAAARSGSTETLAAGEDWKQLPDRLGILPHERAGWEEFAAALRQAVDEDLSDKQRRVFTASTVAGVPADVLAARMGSSRNAVYKALFEARRAVRARLIADGHHPAHHSGSFSAWPRWAGGLLAADPGDAGCEVTFRLLDQYVDGELQGSAAGRRFPAVAAHLLSCQACQQDHRGLHTAAAN